jgi:hemerythrin-like domain-containing protein
LTVTQVSLVKPRGLLMIEHRLIEKMLALTRQELAWINQSGAIDVFFMNAFVDFIRVYADRTHHGKEEDILFEQLKGKNLVPADRAMMDELIAEHQLARRTTAELAQACQAYESGDHSQIDVIKEKIGFLSEFYPLHIDKEDKVFFPNAERYFTNAELDAMLEQFWFFDRRMIHEKYHKLYETLKHKY